MTAGDSPDSMAHDEVVVLQLLEEIHHLIRPGPSGAQPSALRLQAAAKLYLDTRDTFETIERNVEGTQHDRPKFLRKLSKRRGLSSTPRDSMVLSATPPTDNHGRNGSVSSARVQVEAAYMAESLTARSEPASRRASISETTVDSEQLSDAIIDRIQDMFRHLGEKLSRPILDELRHRNLAIQAALHYARFLPPDSQWTAYMEKREEEVRLAYNPQKLSNETLLQQLKRNAEFVKEQIRKDVNTVCLFAPDGTLSTIFGDDINSDNVAVAEKFEALIRDVYARYLLTIIDTKMEQLLRLSDQWQQDMAIMGSSPVMADASHAQLFVRARKFRSKIPIFPHSISAIDERSSMAILPPAPPGHQARVLVADLNHLGVWWQKSILAATDRDVTTIHTDETRAISGVHASLDGQIYVPLVFDSSHDFLRKYAKNVGLAKFQGHRLLVNNGKDSLWVEVTVLEAEEKRCKLQLKKGIEKSPETGSWQQHLASNDWIQIKDLRLCLVPLNPSFRIHMGLKFRTMIDVFQALVTEISSIFPNEDLEHRVGKSLWQAVEGSISRGEHIYARYFRSVLNQELQPRRSSVIAHGSERSPSIMLGSASVRNLVAALEHSAIANNGGSVSGPASSIQGANQPPQRRLSLTQGSNLNLAGRVPEAAFFDDKGSYHHQLVLPDVELRINAPGSNVSPFEKLSHHLLEENEMIGGCIQNNNIALGRAFAQVLQEKFTRLTKQIQTRLDHDDTSSLEEVIAEYANACRFLYTWHIVRHEVDTIGRQRRNKRDTINNIHAEWVDRSFSRMEALVCTMLQLQLQFIHRVFFHEFSSHALPGICEQEWTAGKQWFSNSRCTHSIQFLIFRVQNLLESVVLRQLMQYERTLCVHEKLHEMASWLVVDMVACVASMYESLVVSRARSTQWKIDVLYLVVGVHTILRLLDKTLAPKTAHAQQNGRGAKKPTTEIREICLRLLACLAVRMGPASVVVEEVIAKAEMQSIASHAVDAITEFEVHITAIRTGLGIYRQTSSTLLLDDEDGSMWTIHNALGELDLKHLADAELNWASLIARSNLGVEELLDCVRHRHELGDWEHPPLTDEQVSSRDQLQKCVLRMVTRLDELRASETHSNDHPVGARMPTPDSTDMNTSSLRPPSRQGLLVTPDSDSQLLPNNPFREPSDATLSYPEKSAYLGPSIMAESGVGFARMESQKVLQ